MIVRVGLEFILFRVAAVAIVEVGDPREPFDADVHPAPLVSGVEVPRSGHRQAVEERLPRGLGRFGLRRRLNGIVGNLGRIRRPCLRRVGDGALGEQDLAQGRLPIVQERGAGRGRDRGREDEARKERGNYTSSGQIWVPGAGLKWLSNNDLIVPGTGPI